MGKIKHFDLFALKGKLDDEKYERNIGKTETKGEKVVRIIVVALSAIMFISVFSTFNPPQIVMYLLFAAGISAVAIKIYFAFKK
ncbi:MAG: hypothetical protein WBA54_02280 [Acidaminobacteraceae bacterium]